MTTYSVVGFTLYGIDISGILSNLAADDYVGVRLDRQTVNIRVFGVRFRYN